jgi:hypothetical protein
MDLLELDAFLAEREASTVLQQKFRIPFVVMTEANNFYGFAVFADESFP